MQIYIYIYAFSRRFYPKRLTVHSGYTLIVKSVIEENIFFYLHLRFYVFHVTYCSPALHFLFVLSCSSSWGKPDDCLIQNEPLHKAVQERSKYENSQLSETTNSRKKPKTENTSTEKPKTEKPRTENTSTEKPKTENTSTEKKMSLNVDIKCKIKPSKSKKYLDVEKKGGPKKDSNAKQGSGHGKEKTSGEHTKHENKKTDKVSGIIKKQENTKHETSLKRPEATQKRREKNRDACKKEKMEKATDKQVEDGCETPSMSFEAYLSYDLEPPKRKKSFSDAKNPKRPKTAHKQNSGVSRVKTSKAVTDDPMTMVYKNLQLLLVVVFLQSFKKNSSATMNK